MTIYDISLTLSPTLPTWPGDPELVLEQFESMAKGAHANATRISSSVHLGTHVDAPHHFLNDGHTVEQLSLEMLTGACYVLQLPDGIDAITSEVLDLQHRPRGGTVGPPHEDGAAARGACGSGLAPRVGPWRAWGGRVHDSAELNRWLLELQTT